MKIKDKVWCFVLIAIYLLLYYLKAISTGEFLILSSFHYHITFRENKQNGGLNE